MHEAVQGVGGTGRSVRTGGYGVMRDVPCSVVIKRAAKMYYILPETRASANAFSSRDRCAPSRDHPQSTAHLAFPSLLPPHGSLQSTPRFFLSTLIRRSCPRMTHVEPLDPRRVPASPGRLRARAPRRQRRRRAHREAHLGGPAPERDRALRRHGLGRGGCVPERCVVLLSHLYCAWI